MTLLRSLIRSIRLLQCHIIFSRVLIFGVQELLSIFHPELYFFQFFLDIRVL